MSKKIFFIALMSLTVTSQALGFAGEWESGIIPNKITDVKLSVYNFAKIPGGKEACEDDECFRIDVILNDQIVATWPTSPGKPHYGTKHVGGFTPIYNGRSIHSTHVYGANYISWRYKYKMPYVMYIRHENGKLSNVGLHAGKVDGTRLSHGCLRLRAADAKELNSWVKEAFKNGGDVRIWTKDVADPLS